MSVLEMKTVKDIFLKLHTDIKGKGSETVKPNQNESMSKTKLFGANFMQIGL